MLSEDHINLTSDRCVVGKRKFEPIVSVPCAFLLGSGGLFLALLTEEMLLFREPSP